MDAHRTFWRDARPAERCRDSWYFESSRWTVDVAPSWGPLPARRSQGFQSAGFPGQRKSSVTSAPPSTAIEDPSNTDDAPNLDSTPRID